MANQNNSDNRSGHVDQNDSSRQNRTDDLGKDRVVGRGMSSPDSTEAVLSAETGEPDPRARGEGSLGSGSGGSSSGGSSGQTGGGSRTQEQESHLSAGKSGGNKGGSH